jgi:DNA-binding NarL/FixJ family response regulator
MRILIADDHKIIRDGSRSILEKQAGMVVVGEAANGHEAIALLPKVHPNLVDDTGAQRHRGHATHHERRTAVKVLALSMNSDQRYVVAMPSAGVAGYRLKDAAAYELIHASARPTGARTASWSEATPPAHRRQRA